MEENYNNTARTGENDPGAGGSRGEYPKGKELAVIGVVFGALSCALAWLVGWFLVWLTPAAIIFGAVGVIVCVRAKKEGFKGTLLTVALILSLAGLGGGVVILISCSAFAIWLSCLGKIASKYF